MIQKIVKKFSSGNAKIYEISIIKKKGFKHSFNDTGRICNNPGDSTITEISIRG